MLATWFGVMVSGAEELLVSVFDSIVTDQLKQNTDD
jgi:hypothetical protein